MAATERRPQPHPTHPMAVKAYGGCCGGSSHNLGTLVQKVSFDGPQSPVIVVAPGATVSGKASAQYWKSDSTGYCPGCVVEFTLGVDGVGQVFCDFASSPYPGKSQTVTFSFKAPMTPGRYPMKAGEALQFTCMSAGYPGGEEVGEVIVK